MKRENFVKDKSFKFAVRVVRLFQFLQEERKDFVLSKQILRSGTSVGALIREAEHSESDKDFIHKMSIAQKEINETLVKMLSKRLSGVVLNRYVLIPMIKSS